ncbi:phage tail protein [Catellatospora tritici]|uniref:phage tail protein n=1 Tax=Catellatospora tritici TaxID=2851566 RepID=UPI001C2D700D|nr:phage tail protein [Catellatospora tritici]MBV1850682.1 phage tail protein [Catellatospora tritici]MBV1850935.1 phage tail protein [Catellatospora tritici]
MRRDAIAGMLPAVFQRTMHPSGVLWALLDVMEGLHDSSEARLDAVEDLFHPYRCPERLVPFLARWVSVDHLGSGRDLVAHGAALAQWRGTREGLKAAVVIATGLTEIEIEEAADRPFHLIVRIPAECVLAEQVRHIVELDKPAATTFEMGELP